MYQTKNLLVDVSIRPEQLQNLQYNLQNRLRLTLMLDITGTKTFPRYSQPRVC